MIVNVHFMKVLVTHEYVRACTTYPRSLCWCSLFSRGKMAGADETRRLMRQCASSLLSACHRLERGETESLAAHLQTSNAMTPNRIRFRIHHRQTSMPQLRTAPQRIHLKRASKSAWRCLVLSHLPGKNRLHTPARGNELAIYLVETKHRIMSEIRGHMYSFAWVRPQQTESQMRMRRSIWPSFLLFSPMHSLLLLATQKSREKFLNAHSLQESNGHSAANQSGRTIVAI